jgi:hypothetical protein
MIHKNLDKAIEFDEMTMMTMMMSYDLKLNSWTLKAITCGLVRGTMANIQMLNINEVRNQHANAHSIESYWESNCANCGQKKKKKMARMIMLMNFLFSLCRIRIMQNVGIKGRMAIREVVPMQL